MILHIYYFIQKYIFRSDSRLFNEMDKTNHGKNNIYTISHRRFRKE